MSEQPSKSAMRPVMVLAAALCFSLAYLLSYAPVVKLMGETRPYSTFDFFGGRVICITPIGGHIWSLYQPADWLIDNTPLRGPLFVWAELWGVRDIFSEAAMWR